MHDWVMPFIAVVLKVGSEDTLRSLSQRVPAKKRKSVIVIVIASISNTVTACMTIFVLGFIHFL